MLVLLATAGYFTAEQQARLSGTFVDFIVFLSLSFQGFIVWKLNEIRGSQKAREKLKVAETEAENARRAAQTSRAGDGQVVVSSEVRVVPGEGVDSSSVGALVDAERGRDTAPGALHEMGRPDSDADAANTHKGAI
jgi:hypothetical protein